MTGNLVQLAQRHAGRPLLMRPEAALDLAQRLRDVDARAFARPGRLSALLAKLAGKGGQPVAMDDGDGLPREPLEQRLAYAPLYVGEPDDIGFCWTLKDGVALMQADTPLSDRGEEYCGVVYHGYDTLLAGLREAAADSRVKAIFVRAYCPGGVVASGIDALHAWMLANRAAAGGKPIWIYADMAASAMYWIASGADRIVAGRFGLVGSIGAVIVHENHAKALAEYGVEITAIEFPLGKTDGAWWKDLSAQAREDWEAEIRQCGESFFAAVQAGRPALTADTLEALGARCFMGHHDDPARSALALGLIDAIASEEDAFAELRDLVAGTSRSAPLKSGFPGAAAIGGRGATAPQETPMAAQAQTDPGRQAALQAAEARRAAAQAEIDTLSAETPDTPEEDQDEHDGEDLSPEAAAEADTETAATDAAAEARAIAASAEALAEPALALAAIQSNQTLAQFKATVAAVGGRSSGGQLKATLAGSPRLGADGKSPKVEAALSPTKIYSVRKARAGKSASGK